MRGTILLVDDEPAMRSALTRLLRSHDLHVLDAADGHVALATWLERRHEVDVIVTDLLMPGMSGLQLLNSVRAHHADARLVLMTGADESPGHGEEAPNAVLQKPFSGTQLVDVVESLLPRPA